MTIVSVPYFMGERLSGLDIPAPHRELAPDLPEGSEADRMGVLYQHLAREVELSENPVVYAGDCVAAIGVLAGLQRREVEPKVIWYDAHGDFNTPATTPSGFLGGMPLAMMVGRGDLSIVEAAGLAPIAEEQVVLVGARDLDAGEAVALAASAVQQVSVEELAHTLPPEGPLYVHVDADVVDPGDMPAMNYPVEDGPSLRSVRASLIHLAATGRVVAISFSVWNPAKVGAERAAAATRELAAPFL